MLAVCLFADPLIQVSLKTWTKLCLTPTTWFPICKLDTITFSAIWCICQFFSFSCSHPHFELLPVFHFIEKFPLFFYSNVCKFVRWISIEGLHHQSSDKFLRKHEMAIRFVVMDFKMLSFCYLLPNETKKERWTIIHMRLCQLLITRCDKTLCTVAHCLRFSSKIK